MDLKKPCKHCPFADTPTRIRFACEERAEEIAESAYRHGFPCHKSAEFVDDDDGRGGFHPRVDGQHCIGSVMLFINSGYDTWPGTGNRELSQRILDRLSPHLGMVFDDEESFIAANAPSIARAIGEG